MEKDTLKVKATREPNTKGGKKKWLVDEPTISMSAYMHPKAKSPRFVQVELLDVGEEDS